MSYPPTDTRPAPAPSYDLPSVLVASLLLVTGLFLTVAAVSAPVVTTLAVATAMVVRRFHQEVAVARTEFPHTGEERCFCIPGTERCIHV